MSKRQSNAIQSLQYQIFQHTNRELAEVLVTESKKPSAKRKKQFTNTEQIKIPNNMKYLIRNRSSDNFLLNEPASKTSRKKNDNEYLINPYQQMKSQYSNTHTLKVKQMKLSQSPYYQTLQNFYYQQQQERDQKHKHKNHKLAKLTQLDCEKQIKQGQQKSNQASRNLSKKLKNKKNQNSMNEYEIDYLRNLSDIKFTSRPNCKTQLTKRKNFQENGLKMKKLTKSQSEGKLNDDKLFTCQNSLLEQNKENQQSYKLELEKHCPYLKITEDNDPDVDKMKKEFQSKNLKAIKEQKLQDKQHLYFQFAVQTKKQENSKSQN